MLKLQFRYFSIFFCTMLVPFQGLANGLTSWIDKETGRTVIRVAPEPFATLPYFTANIFTSDSKYAFYTSAKGVHRANLNDFSTKIVVSARESEIQIVEIGKKTNNLYFLSRSKLDKNIFLKSINLHTETVVTHSAVPEGHRIESINSDETLAVGVKADRALTEKERAFDKLSKGEYLYTRVDAKIPMMMFLLDLSNGHISSVHQSTDWLAHPQFSPVDPSLIMFSHEGPWHKVNRIWVIRADGSGLKLVHQRKEEMEIAGHEFWSSDGTTIHYDWQKPKGKRFYLASYKVATAQPSSTSLKNTQWSIHFNSSHRPDFFVGDGADVNQVSKSADSLGIYGYTLTRTCADTCTDEDFQTHLNSQNLSI